MEWIILLILLYIADKKDKHIKPVADDGKFHLFGGER
jgi:hypothetical protein